MLGKCCSIVVAITLIFALSACGEKEEAVIEEIPAELETPAVVPGEMVLIPAGEFILGSEDKENTAYPQQTIDLPAYYIDKYEVTFSEFLDFSINSGYAGEGAKEGKDWRAFFTPDKALNPVVYVTWKDANSYCEFNGKRLPTEQEWEKAARGTDGRRYPWGNEWEPGRSNTYEAGITQPTAIGEFDDVSPYDVHDMLGNVQEWTADWYVTYKGNPKKDPDSGRRLKVVRGLSSRYYGARGYLSNRSAYPAQAIYDFGFRCAKDATDEGAAEEAQSQ